jgi:DNA-binding transcriptional ArsR family regulator
MHADPLSQVFQALADPTRRAILARLIDGPATVNEIAKPFPISLPSVSKHLKILEHAGLISRGREAQWRPCRLEPEHLRIADAWFDLYRRFWDGSFAKLHDFLTEPPQDDKEELQ